MCRWFFSNCAFWYQDMDGLWDSRYISSTSFNIMVLKADGNAFKKFSNFTISHLIRKNSHNIFFNYRDKISTTPIIRLTPLVFAKFGKVVEIILVPTIWIIKLFCWLWNRIESHLVKTESLKNSTICRFNQDFSLFINY